MLEAQLVNRFEQRLQSLGMPVSVEFWNGKRLSLGDLPKLNEPATDHKSVRIKVPGKAGAEKASIVFELVYKGHGHIQ